MTITFSNALTENKEILCNLIYHDNFGVEIHIQEHDFLTNHYNNGAIYQIDKNQLRDFIGALLHLQSKIK